MAKGSNAALFDYKEKAVSDLIPYARNSRTHSDAQVAQIAASIKEFGFTNPILVDVDNGIIAGHGRLLAAQKLGLNTVRCIVADGWTESQKRAYVIADNKLALNAGWDNEMLRVEMRELESNAFDLTLTGFSVEELSGIFLEPNFDAGSTDDQGKLDQLSPRMIECPHCGGEFDMREHG